METLTPQALWEERQAEGFEAALNPTVDDITPALP